jgi:hypothetical protein
MRTIVSVIPIIPISEILSGWLQVSHIMLFYPNCSQAKRCVVTFKVGTFCRRE